MARAAGACFAANVETAFYSVADSAAFVGAAGLLNSLRLAGHDEPFFLLDCGLTAEQRATLEPHATLVAAESDIPATAAKAIAPLQAPAEAMVLLDADVIVTRHLGELVARCAGGKIVVFPDDTPGRFFSEWTSLGLGTPVRRPYVSAGHLLVPVAWRVALLERLSKLAATIDPGRTFVDGGSPDDPLYYLDQDVLNAMLATVIPADAVDRSEEGLVAYAPFHGLTCDAETLECRDAQGRKPFLLHHILRKPWSAALPESVYSTLLRRLLNGPDVARPGSAAAARSGSGAARWLRSTAGAPRCSLSPTTGHAAGLGSARALSKLFAKDAG